VAVHVDLTHYRKHMNHTYRRVKAKGDMQQARFVVIKGGAGSGKSYFAAQDFLERIMVEFTPHGQQHKILIVRKWATTHRHSTFALFRQQIADRGLSHLFTVRTSTLEIEYKPTGGMIIFAGLDNVEKLKSIAGVTSIWIEEATEITQADFEQVNLRLRGRCPYHKQIVLTFNPISAEHWIKAYFYDTPRDDTYRLLTTYRDNPWLDTMDVKQLKDLRNRDLQLWRVYCEGLWGVLKGLIYSFEVVPDFPPAVWEREPVIGTDWGYNDPLASVAVRKYDGALYANELFYRTGVTTEEFVRLLPDIGVKPDWTMYGDAAEPDRIKTLKDANYNCVAAHKGPGSVRAGIDFLKGERVYILASSENLVRESKAYKWREDPRSNKLLDEPVDAYNHALDALRYAAYSHYWRPEKAIKTGVARGVGINE